MIWLAALLTAATVTHALQSSDADWVVSAGDERSSLYPSYAERKESWFELACSGNPPRFSWELRPNEDTLPQFDGVRLLPGTFRIGDKPPSTVEWEYDRVSFRLDVHGGDVTELGANGGTAEMEVFFPDGAVFRHVLPSSETLVPAVSRFLDACGRHVRLGRRELEIDGVQVELQIELDGEEIEEMLALAEKLGIRDPERVFVGFEGLPASWLTAIVIARERRTDRVVSRPSLCMLHERWNRSLDVAKGEIVSHGRWRTSATHLDPGKRYIVREGSWKEEVEVGPGVSYDAASRILRAIRHGQLVDARDPNLHPLFAVPSPTVLERTRAATPPKIVRLEEGSADADFSRAERYRVTPTYGWTLVVRIAGDVVEVEQVSKWVV